MGKEQGLVGMCHYAKRKCEVVLYSFELQLYFAFSSHNI